MAEEEKKNRSLNDMIFIIRDQRVMIDRDLARLYEVPTFRLNEAVKRHKSRFPLDFMFRITKEELDELIAKCDEFIPLRHSSSFPYAFTEHGVAMLASVLNSERAIEINIENCDTKFSEHEKSIREIIHALNSLLEAESSEPRKIGFTDKNK